MTLYTIHAYVTSGKWECSSIVIKCVAIGFSLRVTSQTGGIAVHVATYSLVLIIGFRILMTSNTSYLCIIGRVVMTIDTLCPLSVVTTTVDWEIQAIVIKRSGHPCIFIVTGCAVCRKLCGHVIWIGCSCVVGVMAAITCIGCRIVTTAVTCSAIIGNSSVSPIQSVILIVNGESSR